ncbi:MAG: GTPase Era [Treponema sp.]
MEEKRCGIVSIIGRPSSGKSTFLNYVSGGKVSIVSKMPQTTLNAIRGIVTLPNGQIIFIDTPGYNISTSVFNLKLQEIAVQSLNDADVILYIIDVTRSFGEEEEAIIKILQNVSKPIAIAFNKIDDKHANRSLSFVSLQTYFPKLSNDNSVLMVGVPKLFDVSAKTGEGIDVLIQSIVANLPLSPLLYPPEFYTDQDVSFRIEEIIREQIILNTKDEVPHATYVKIDDMKMQKNGKRLNVKATLYADRESQKGILIGKDASVIKKIRINAEKELFKLFPYFISLELKVKVDKNWRVREGRRN